MKVASPNLAVVNTHRGLGKPSFGCRVEEVEEVGAVVHEVLVE